MKIEKAVQKTIDSFEVISKANLSSLCREFETLSGELQQGFCMTKLHLDGLEIHVGECVGDLRAQIMTSFILLNQRITNIDNRISLQRSNLIGQLEELDGRIHSIQRRLQDLINILEAPRSSIASEEFRSILRRRTIRRELPGTPTSSGELHSSVEEFQLHDTEAEAQEVLAEVRDRYPHLDEVELLDRLEYERQNADERGDLVLEMAIAEAIALLEFEIQHFVPGNVPALDTSY